MADDFNRKAVILVSIGRGWCVHATSMPCRESPQQVDNAQNVHLPLQSDESCGISEHYMDSTTQLCYARVVPLADAVITLSCPGPAPFWPGDVPGEPLTPHPTGNAVFNYPSSMLFAPAVTMPLLSVGGMPVGVQLMGQQHDDARITAMARWLLETVPPVVR
jgi:Asp-tRNA(Asn)/Glu-tRNA(Gln) amidotransferase A subunit family amidase